MRILILLIAVGVVAYGVVNDHLGSVLAGAFIAWISHSPFWRVSAEKDASRFKTVVQGMLGQVWQQLLLLALLCSLAAGWLAHKDVFSRNAGYLWALGLLLCLIAGYWHDYVRPGLGAAGQPKDSQRWTWLDWLLVLALTAVALGLRLYQISEYLPPVHGDEGEMGMLALLALHGSVAGLSSDPLPFFATGFLDHPTLFHYFQALGLLFFGETLTGLRILSAIVGALCATVAYAIGKISWGRWAGVSAAWLLAVSHLHIHYSRIALNNIETVLFTMMLIWLLIVASRAAPSHPLLPLIGSGLVMGVGQYLYYGSRLMPVLALPLLVYLWRQKQLTLQQAAVMLQAGVVAFFPQAVHYFYHFITFLNRSTTVNAFTPGGMAHTLGPGALWPQDLPQLLWHQLQMNLEFFIRQGDRSAFYLADIPAFDQVTAILFWLGLALALTRLRQFPEVALLIWFGVGILLAGVLTIDAPNGPRLIVLVPAIYCLAGLVVQYLMQLLAQIWPRQQKPLGVILAGALAVCTLYLNFTTYFVQFNRIRPNLGQISIATEIASAGQTERAYLLGTPNYFVEHGTVRFVARGVEKFNIAQEGDLQQLLSQQTPQKGVLIVALPNHLADLEQIAADLPNGTREAHYDLQGNALYFTYRVSSTQVALDLRR